MPFSTRLARLRPIWTPFAAALVAIPVVAGCKLIQHGPKTDFNGQQALAYAKAQVDFGPRVPGTAAHDKAGEWIRSEMAKRADTVIVQSWSYSDSSLPKPVTMTNYLARFNPKATSRILYVTHWDTRRYADDDPNLGKRRQSFDGANDGASGVGLFLALGDVLKKTPPTTGVDLLFVDGEDWGSFDNYSDTSKTPQVLIGSTYFANHLPEPGYKPLFGVLFDMIADKDLDIEQETNSINAAPEVVQRVWSTASQLGYSKYFVNSGVGAITDDHVPLIKQGGLRIIDVIDIHYETGGPGGDQNNYHHTSMDTMDKITAESLQIVGDVAVTLLR